MSRRPILRVNDLWLDAPGGRPLMRALDLCLGAERVALVGRNGVGKSSLLDVLAGREQPTRGEVIRDGRTVLVRQDLGEAFQLSPGEQRKRALDEARRVEPDLLLLDEPTRDLDAPGVEWLAEWLGEWDRALIVVSHDRRVLRRFRLFFVVAESGCRAFEGSYEELLVELERAEAETARKYARNLARLLEKEQHNATVRRRRERKKNVGRIRELGRCPARIRLNGKRSYKQVSQGTRAVLQRDRISALREWAQSTRRALSVALPVSLVLPALPKDSGRPVAILNGVSARARDRTLFSGLDGSFGRERVAVTGPNGSGKTTLLGILLGERKAESGHAFADRQRIGFIAQNAANWCLDESLLALLLMGTDATLDQCAEILATHQFPFALAERSLRSLSPGERVRAALISLFRRRPAIELLVLDEPTDDLDLLALVALESVLRAWTGGLVVASHDAEFLHAIAVTERIELDGRGGHTTVKG